MLVQERAAPPLVPRLAHRPALDGLRGLAVISVLLYHTGVLRGGWIGVDTFFVLSGYLITSLLVAEHDRSGRVDLRAFWTRRARRLLPGLFALLAGVALFAALLASAEARTVIRQDVWAALTYSSNWVAIFRGTGYWQEFAQPSPLAHVWSLAIEEQFYLLWPLVAVFALRRGGSRRVAIVAGVGAGLLAAWALALYVTGASVDRLYLGADTRAPALLLGAVLGALRVGNGHPRLEATARVAGPLGVAALVWAAFMLDGRDPATYRGFLLAVSAAGALAVFGACQPGSGRFGRWLGWRPLCIVGLLSYGIYLAHWPILLVVQAQTDLGPWATTAVVAPLTFAVAGASYVLLEQPMRHRGLRAWRSPLLVPVVAVACAVAAFAGTAGVRPAFDAVDERQLLRSLPVVSDGIDSSTAPSVGTLPATVPPTVGTTAPVPTTLPAPAPVATVPAAPLVVPAPRPVGRAARVLVVGDSVAYSLTSALTNVGRANAVDVAVRASPGCSLDEQAVFERKSGTEKPPAVCTKILRRLPDDVQRFQPDLVLMVYGGYMTDWVLDGAPTQPCDPAYDQRFGELVDQTIDVLSSAGGRVVIALPAYNRVYGQLDDLDTMTDCLSQIYTSAVARHPDRASLMRLDLFACPTQTTCESVEVDGHQLRYDGLHYRSHAATTASQWILDQILQPVPP